MKKPRPSKHARAAGAPHIGRCGPTGKNRYRSIGAAQLAIEHLQEKAGRNEQPRPELRAYRCWYCDGWHLTSQAKAEGRRSLARRVRFDGKPW